MSSNNNPPSDKREENKSSISSEISGNHGSGGVFGFNYGGKPLYNSYEAKMNDLSASFTLQNKRGGTVGLHYNSLEAFNPVGPATYVESGTVMVGGEGALVGSEWKKPLVLGSVKVGVGVMSAEMAPGGDADTSKATYPAVGAVATVALNDRRYLPGLRGQASFLAGQPLKESSNQAQAVKIDLEAFKTFTAPTGVEVTLSAGVNSTHLSVQGNNGYTVSNSGLFSEGGFSHGLNPTVKLGLKLPLGR